MEAAEKLSKFTNDSHGALWDVTLFLMMFLEGG